MSASLMLSLSLDFEVDQVVVGLEEVAMMSSSFSVGLLGDSEQDQVALGRLPPYEKYLINQYVTMTRQRTPLSP